MKKFIPVILFCFSSFTIFSQDILPPDSGFEETSIAPCPFDPSEEIRIFDHWLIYQTLNNQWDGEIDSSICISVKAITGDWGIDLSNADVNRALFIRSLVNEVPKPYLNDLIYILSSVNKLTPNLSLNLQDTCANNICSGLLTAIEIPDSLGTGTDLRLHSDIFDIWASQDWNFVKSEMCIPTEKFDKNDLKEVIFKFTFDEESLSGKEAFKFNFYAEESSDVQLLSEINITDGPNGGVYNYYFSWHFDFWSPILALYTADTYPNAANPSYIEPTLIPNSSDQETIYVNFNFGFELMFQHFTFLRGSLVESNDSLRHQVIFQNDGGEICYTSIADLVFGDNTVYRHKEGKLNFVGNNSCMGFKPDAAIEVVDNATLHYGDGGEGILNLHPGSTIRIGKNATMLIDNLLWMVGKPKEGQPSQIFMELNPTSQLIFGENAKISNLYARSPDTKLNIYMNGGFLDDSKLDATSRNLINKIYPETKPVFRENVKTYPNPVSDFLQIEFLSNGNEKLALNFKDINGKLLKSESRITEKGINFFEMEISHFANGIYFLEILGNEGKAIEKILKQ